MVSPHMFGWFLPLLACETTDGEDKTLMMTDCDDEGPENVLCESDCASVFFSSRGDGRKITDPLGSGKAHGTIFQPTPTRHLENQDVDLHNTGSESFSPIPVRLRTSDFGEFNLPRKDW